MNSMHQSRILVWYPFKSLSGVLLIFIHMFNAYIETNCDLKLCCLNGFITRLSTIVTFDTRREDGSAVLLRYVLISLLIVLTSKMFATFQ